MNFQGRAARYLTVLKFLSRVQLNSEEQRVEGLISLAGYSLASELESISLPNYRKLIQNSLKMSDEGAIDKQVSIIYSILNDEEFIESLDDIESSFQGEILNWLKREILSNLHDLEYFSARIKNFHWKMLFLGRRFLPVDKRQLSAIKDIAELELLEREVRPQVELAAYKVKVDKTKAVATTEILLDNDKWRIAIPHSRDAAIQEGSGATWCTSSRSEANLFHRYHKPDESSFLYIVTDKQTGEKYQMHYGKKEFMDQHNRPLENDDVSYLHSLIESTNRLKLPGNLKQVVFDVPDYDWLLLKHEYFRIDFGSRNFTFNEALRKISSVQIQKQPVYAQKFISNSGGKPHSLTEPAVITTHGDVLWFKDGKLHRDGGPAVELLTLAELWFTDGKLNRVGGPAVKTKHGDIFYYKNGLIHNDAGPAILLDNGQEFYVKNGKYIPLTVKEMPAKVPIIMSGALPVQKDNIKAPPEHSSIVIDALNDLIHDDSLDDAEWRLEKINASKLIKQLEHSRLDVKMDGVSAAVDNLYHAMEIENCEAAHRAIEKIISLSSHVLP